jgi:hypothetical protein
METLWWSRSLGIAFRPISRLISSKLRFSRTVVKPARSITVANSTHYRRASPSLDWHGGGLRMIQTIFEGALKVGWANVLNRQPPSRSVIS